MESTKLSTSEHIMEKSNKSGESLFWTIRMESSLRVVRFDQIAAGSHLTALGGSSLGQVLRWVFQISSIGLDEIEVFTERDSDGSQNLAPKRIGRRTPSSNYGRDDGTSGSVEGGHPAGGRDDVALLFGYFGGEQLCGAYPPEFDTVD